MLNRDDVAVEIMKLILHNSHGSINGTEVARESFMMADAMIEESLKPTKTAGVN